MMFTGSAGNVKGVRFRFVIDRPQSLTL